MTSKIIEARVIQKVATEAEWLNTTLPLYQGEIAFVSDKNNFKLNTQLQSKTFSELEYYYKGDVVGNVKIGDDLNSKSDGVYYAQTSGTYGGVVVKEGYYTLLRKSGNVWSLEMEVKMPEVKGTDILDPNGQQVPKEKAVADYTEKKINDLREGQEQKAFTTTNHYINKNSTIGQTVTPLTSANWKLSSFIDIKTSDTIIRKGSVVLESSNAAEIYFFDSDNKYLGFLNKGFNSYEVKPSDRPSNAVKVRLNSENSYNGEFSFFIKNQIKSKSVEDLQNISTLNSFVKNINGFSKPENGYIDGSGRVVNTDSSSVWRMTPYIKVIEGQKVVITSTTGATGSAYPLYGYDNYFNPTIPLLNRGTNTNKEVTIPFGVEYIKACGNNTSPLKLELTSFNQDVVNSNDMVSKLVNDIFIPSKVYAKSGEDISFNINGIVNKHPKDYSRDVFFNFPNGNEDFLKLTPTIDFVVPIRERLLNQNSIVLGELKVKVKGTVANPSTPHYFIHFGDSTVRCFQNSNIEGAIVNELSRRLNGIGTAITPENSPAPLAMSNIHFIGTLGDKTVKHEGRGGWSFNDYNTLQNKSGSSNAFWNPNTNSFDLNYYLTQNSFSQISGNGDNLTILCQLGWNDVFTRTLTQIEADVKAWLNSVKTSKPSIKVKLISMQLPPYDVYKSYTGTREQSYISTMQRVISVARLYERIMNDLNFSSWVEHISCMPTFFSDGSYPSQDLQVNKRSSTTQKVYTDDVHPNAIGYAQMADTLFYNILYNYC